jgi:ribulose 1,5-bisphosphate synthetase/thiazole synthase
MHIKTFVLIISLFIFSYLTSHSKNGLISKRYDIVIYGGTSAGIAAAIQGSRMGKTLLLIERSSRIGGLTTGGLGATDIGNKQAIGGVTNIGKRY